MSSERATSTKVGGSTMMTDKPTEPEQLPCPRCDSTNTKFCYYNNYNLSQPRHFCKACRRYWTRGGALRNVPVGGGTRRSSSSKKRPRTDSSSTSSTTISVNSSHEVLNSLPMVSDMGHVPGNSGSFMGQGYDVNLNEALPETGSFSSLLNSDGHPGNVFWGVPHRFVGAGLYGMGFGLNILDFPMEQERDNNVSGGGGGEVPASSGGNTWQINDGNDNFSWPDLAISTPGKSLK